MTNFHCYLVQKKSNYATDIINPFHGKMVLVVLITYHLSDVALRLATS